MEPLEEPGLRLLQNFPIATEPQPPKSRGPYLYLNERSMPRAYLAAKTVVVDGSESAVKSTVLAILADARFHPDRFTLVAAPEKVGVERSLALDRIDWHLASNPSAVVATRMVEREQLFEAPDRRDPFELVVNEYLPERLSIELPNAALGRWVVLSEKFAMFNGWKAAVDTEDGAVNIPLFRANHVNTAIWVPPESSGSLHLSYTSPGFHGGLAAFFVTLAPFAFHTFRRR